MGLEGNAKHNPFGSKDIKNSDFILQYSCFPSLVDYFSVTHLDQFSLCFILPSPRNIHPQRVIISIHNNSFKKSFYMMNFIITNSPNGP